MKFSKFCAASILMASASAPALAQSQNDSPNYRAQEDGAILVIGTKLATDVQDTEISTEIFDEERLNKEQITELSELLRKAPNVNTSGGADANFSIRGIGRNGVGGAGQGVTSNIYVDGSPISSLNLNRGPLALWDIKQVEVLRGPQSSIQGRNALGGSIFIQTADPTFTTEGKFRASYAEANTYQIAGAFSAPLVDGLLAGRIAVDAQGSDGFITNALLDGAKFNVTESLTIRGKLLLEPDAAPGFMSKLSVEYNESEVFGEDNSSVTAPVDSISDPSFADFDPGDYVTFRAPRNNDNDGLRIVSETAYEFSDAITARAILTYEDYSTFRTFGDENDVSRFGLYVENRFDEKNYSAEGRVEFDYDTLKGLVGIYYYNDERKNNLAQNVILLDEARALAGPLAGLVNVSPPDSLLELRGGQTFSTENYAIFAQFDWNFAPQWTLGLGARYDYEDFKESDRFQSTTALPDACLITAPAVILGIPSPNPFETFTLPCQPVVESFFGTIEDPELSADFDAFLPRISLTYDINENSSVFLSASRGYRAGGAFVAIRENPATIGFEQFVGEYDPEFLTTLEIGTRNILLNGKLTLNANIFYSFYDDQQVLVDGFDPLQARDDLIVNAGKSSLYGAELLADYSVSDDLSFFVSMGLLETEFDDFPFAVDSDGNPTNPSDPRFANLAGDEFPGAPNLTFTVGGDWQSESGFFANASFTYTGGAQSGIPNIDNNDLRQGLIDIGADPDLAGDLAETSSARTDLTARLGWQNNILEIYVFGTNLLDDDGFSSRSFASVGGNNGQVLLSDPVFSLQKPRVLGVGLDMNF